MLNVNVFLLQLHSPVTHHRVKMEDAVVTLEVPMTAHAEVDTLDKTVNGVVSYLIKVICLTIRVDCIYLIFRT